MIVNWRSSSPICVDSLVPNARIPSPLTSNASPRPTTFRLLPQPPHPHPRPPAYLQATLHAELEAIDHILPVFPAPLSSVTLYVTVEPCVMCASALRQIGIGAVYYGCGNDRFGGCGSVIGVNEE